MTASGARLVLFDLDGTLLDGDTDVLWCDFLIDEGVLDRAVFAAANREVADRYARGAITAEAFCDFYAGTLAGRTPAGWAPLRERFVAEQVAPRLKPAGLARAAAHREAGEHLVLTTATGLFLAEPIAARLGIDDVIATELATVDDGDAASAFSGRTRGTVNMRGGKPVRLAAWLDARGLAEGVLDDAVFYSDSINDLPLLEAVGRPVCVDPDPKLAAEAARRGWPVERFALADAG